MVRDISFVNLQKIWAVNWGDAIFLLSSARSADVDILCSGPIFQPVKFHNFMCICTRLISTRVVCVSGKHPQFLTNWTWAAMKAAWREEGWVGFRPWERMRILKPGLTACFSFYLIRSSSFRLFDFFFCFCYLIGCTFVEDNFTIFCSTHKVGNVWLLYV